MLHVIMYIKE